MLEYAQALLKAERRARALVIRHPPLTGESWTITSVPGPDGAAWLAVARLAARLGARVSVALATGKRGSLAWDILADNCRKQGLVSLEAASGPTRAVIERDGQTETLKSLPDPVTAWAITLAESPGMAAPATAESPIMTCAECRNVDRKAIELYGVPGISLMEHAAVAAVSVALSLFDPVKTNRVLIIAGGGNNGGDGLAMARGFHTLGIHTEVALLKPASKLRGDAGINLELLRRCEGVPIRDLHANPIALSSMFEGKTLIVDALLGTGFTGGLSPEFKSTIDWINASGIPVLALDLPSGLDGDTGQPAETAVRATACVTFAAVKKGLTIADGPRHCGTLYLGDIGAPTEALSGK